MPKPVQLQRKGWPSVPAGATRKSVHFTTDAGKVVVVSAVACYLDSCPNAIAAVFPAKVQEAAREAGWGMVRDAWFCRDDLAGAREQSRQLREQGV